MTSAEIQQKIWEAFNKLTGREKGLIFGTIFLGLFLGFWSVASSVIGIFAEQERRLTVLEKNLTSASFALDRYEKLRERLQLMEKNFKQEGPPGGMRSYLESSVTSKAGVTAPNFTIKAGIPSDLGENYMKYPYTVTFNTTSIGKIVDFLQEITAAESNLVLTKLEITKGRMNEKLGVVVDVSNVTSAQK
jgi:hypothetical protein